MKRILVFRHVANEGPGYLARFLDRHKLPYAPVNIDAGDAVPTALAGISGLVFMGGPMSVNDPLPWIPPVLALIRQAVDAGIPVLGHCLGGQLMSKALGGVVTRNPVKEIGWLPVQRYDNDMARTWLSALPSSFEVFHWHGETFSLPPGATALLKSPACANQGFVLGNSLALQCHIEMLPAMVSEWAAVGADDIAQPSTTVQSLAQMNVDLDARCQRLHRIADTIYSHWITGLR